MCNLQLGAWRDKVAELIALRSSLAAGNKELELEVQQLFADLQVWAEMMESGHGCRQRLGCWIISWGLLNTPPLLLRGDCILRFKAP